MAEQRRAFWDLQPLPPAKPAQPVAWIRQHPDGTLTGELLLDSQIEDVRKRSGAWVPLGRIDGVEGRSE